MKKRILAIPLVLLVAMSLVAFGCPPVPVEPVVVVEPPVVIEWTSQSMDPPGTPAYRLTVKWAEDIYRLSGGRLRITVHPSGAIVPLLEAFPAVSKGTLDVAHMWHPFWVGIDPVFGIFCGSAMGMTPHETVVWYFEWGGEELVAEKYAEYNIHHIGAGSTPAEVFLWASHPVRTFADLEGLTVRAAGLSLAMFGRLGISAYWMPGGETPPALLKGVVDAAEFATFAYDVAIGFHEAVPYAMVGPRATTMTYNMLINMDRWNELPPDLQAIVTNVSHKHMLWSLSLIHI